LGYQGILECIIVSHAVQNCLGQAYGHARNQWRIQDLGKEGARTGRFTITVNFKDYFPNFLNFTSISKLLQIMWWACAACAPPMDPRLRNGHIALTQMSMTTVNITF
jgi:hypothetical protein